MSEDVFSCVHSLGTHVEGNSSSLLLQHVETVKRVKAQQTCMYYLFVDVVFAKVLRLCVCAHETSPIWGETEKNGILIITIQRVCVYAHTRPVLFGGKRGRLGF